MTKKGDLISRQAVLDRTVNRNSIWNTITDSEGNNLEDIINSIPPTEIKGEPIECARTLKKHCINTKDCKECFMWDECKYELSAPCDWDLPDGEKGGE